MTFLWYLAVEVKAAEEAKAELAEKEAADTVAAETATVETAVETKARETNEEGGGTKRKRGNTLLSQARRPKAEREAGMSIWQKENELTAAGRMTSRGTDENDDL